MRRRERCRRQHPVVIVDHGCDMEILVRIDPADDSDGL